MIVDARDNFGKYVFMNPRFKVVEDFFKSRSYKDLTLLKDGRIELSDDKSVYAIVVGNSFQTPNQKWEVHRKYIDIQYVIEGEEGIGWRILTEEDSKSAYDSEKDCSLFPVTNEDDPCIVIHQDELMILFETDVHKPCCPTAKSSKARKIIFKVLI